MFFSNAYGVCSLLVDYLLLVVVIHITMVLVLVLLLFGVWLYILGGGSSGGSGWVWRICSLVRCLRLILFR